MAWTHPPSTSGRSWRLFGVLFDLDKVCIPLVPNAKIIWAFIRYLRRNSITYSYARCSLSTEIHTTTWFNEVTAGSNEGVHGNRRNTSIMKSSQPWRLCRPYVPHSHPTLNLERWIFVSNRNAQVPPEGLKKTGLCSAYKLWSFLFSALVASAKRWVVGAFRVAALNPNQSVPKIAKQ